jgi:hypothetical protein
MFLDPGFVSSRDRRLIYFFGECEPAGYGYLKRVLTAYSRIDPTSRRRPVIRYRDYNRMTEYLFEPTRFEADPSVVVGVGLSDFDMREQQLGRATPDANGNWRFAIGTNFDLLTGIEVELDPDGRRDIRLRLYRKENDAVPAWTAMGSAAHESNDTTGPVRLRFPIVPPLTGFRSDMVLFVIRAEGPAIRRMTAHGITANMEGYRVVHRDRNGACFTAVRRGDEERWTSMVRDLENWDD